MKSLTGIAAALLIALTATTAQAAEDADAILGMWTTEKQDTIFEIYKQDDKYHAKIIWLREPVYPAGDPEAGVTKHDRNNPDESQRDTPMLGYVFLKNFSFDDDKWTGGTIYDPLEGKTYKSQIKLKDGVLNVRGYVGLPVLGRTVEWSRPGDDLLKLKAEADASKS